MALAIGSAAAGATAVLERRNDRSDRSAELWDAVLAVLERAAVLIKSQLLREDSARTLTGKFGDVELLGAAAGRRAASSVKAPVDGALEG